MPALRLLLLGDGDVLLLDYTDSQAFEQETMVRRRSDCFCWSRDVRSAGLHRSQAFAQGTIVRRDAEGFRPELWMQLLYHRYKWIFPAMQAVIDLLRAQRLGIG